jgi:hypothetical protein
MDIRRACPGVPLKVIEAVPWAFRRAYPKLDPRTPIIAALSLLRYHEVDALPLSLSSDLPGRALSGYSCLTRLLALAPHGLDNFLEEPCGSACEPLTTIGAEEDVASILDEFQRTRFCYAEANAGGGRTALFGLFDFLDLYEQGVFGTRLGLGDVASPIVSMEGAESLRSALGVMFGRRHRRVFLTGTANYIWDYSILEHLVSPKALIPRADQPLSNVLEAPISEIEPAVAVRVSDGLSLKDAARGLKKGRGTCLTFGDSVVTPWDVVMKPWMSGALEIRPQ